MRGPRGHEPRINVMNSLMKSNPSELIPPSVKVDGEVTIKKVNIRSILNEEREVVIVYEVKWREEKEKKVEEVKEEKGKEEEKVEEEDTQRELEKMMSSRSRSKVHDGVKAGGCICEGPCGKWRKMKDIVQFGCDHIICKLCRQTANSTILFDGSPGCSNKKCVAEAIADGEKIMVGRSVSRVPSDLSMRSNEGPWEILAVRVVIMRKVVGQMFKTHLDYEFPSQSRIANLTKTLAEFKDIIKTGVCYYSLKKPKVREDLELISLKDTNLRFYHLPGYSFTSGKVYFVVVGRGIKLRN